MTLSLRSTFSRRATPVRKSFARLAPDAALAADDRTISYVFSDESVARDGNTISTAGWQLDNFKKNPICLWAHDCSAPPIGRVPYVNAVGTQLLGAVRFAEREEFAFADVIYRLYKGRYLNAVSVSWLPIKWQYSTDKSRPGGIDFSEVELLEVSAVPLPSLPTALATARGAGIDVAPVAAWAERTLDLGQAPINRKELEMVRSQAAPASRKVYYSAQPSLVRGKPRSAAPVGSAAVTIIESSRQPLFRSFGEFLNVVALGAARGGRPDQRLARAPTGLGEVDPTAGGFAVPDLYSEELIGSMYEEAVLAPLCDRRETDKPNNAQLPAIDEKSRADGSRWGGTLSYWEGEGTAAPSTLPRFKKLQFSARKLIALCVASDELIADVPLLDGHMRRAFASEASFQLDKAILLGSGVGVPLGLCNAPGRIQVAKDVGQASATITATNVSGMWSRLPAPSRKRAVWVCNEDAESQLESFASPSTSGMYYPAGANGNECALVKGRPVIVAEQCPALGTPGDIVLADLSQYIIVDGGLQSALSLDCDFLTDQGVFRFVLRVDGAPAWQSPVTPFNGTLSRSPFVVLSAR